MYSREQPRRRRDDGSGRADHSRAAEDPLQHVLALQRASGNQAVTQMVQGLARKPKPKRSKERPASTDAPGYKAPKPKASSTSSATAPPKRLKKARGLTHQQMGWDVGTLLGHARDASNDGAHLDAAEMLERAYELQPRRDIALNIFRAYKALGETEHADYWLKVTNGVITPGQEPERPVSEQMF